jgi:hypothetical protein
VQAEEDTVDELQECPDHRLSSFERDKAPEHSKSPTL